MRAVMISIKPEWCELIAKKQKTIEVRKTKPKLKTPFKCYIYETKGLYRGSGGCLFQGLGKVIGEFVCDDISKNYVRYDSRKDEYGYWTLLDDSCLTKNQLMEYGKCHTLYGWHISDLVIYDKQKELYEFNKLCTIQIYTPSFLCYIVFVYLLISCHIYIIIVTKTKINIIATIKQIL